MGKLIRIPVAPFVGVWIEIPDGISPQFTFIVAPFVGVWIEICQYVKVGIHDCGRSLRGSVD